jgi:hypothetical protein
VQQRLHELRAARGLNEDHLRLLAQLDGNRGDTRDRAQALDHRVARSEGFDLDDRPVGDPALQMGRRT